MLDSIQFYRDTSKLQGLELFDEIAYTDHILPKMCTLYICYDDQMANPTDTILMVATFEDCGHSVEFMYHNNLWYRVEQGMIFSILCNVSLLINDYTTYNLAAFEHRTHD